MPSPDQSSPASSPVTICCFCGYRFPDTWGQRFHALPVVPEIGFAVDPALAGIVDSSYFQTAWCGPVERMSALDAIALLAWRHSLLAELDLRYGVPRKDAR